MPDPLFAQVRRSGVLQSWTFALRSSEMFTYSMMRLSSHVAMMPLSLQEEVRG
jgi:hypothetical protein